MLTEPGARFSDIISKILYQYTFLVKSAGGLKCEIRDLFLLVEQNRALYFFRPSKIQGKIQLLMVLYNGS